MSFMGGLMTHPAGSIWVRAADVGVGKVPGSLPWISRAAGIRKEDVLDTDFGFHSNAKGCNEFRSRAWGARFEGLGGVSSWQGVDLAGKASQYERGSQMNVTDLLDEKGGKPVISFEFSRPKTEKATANLENALDKLVEAKPDYVSVTFGAGGSTREGSFELVEKLNANARELPTVAYLAGVGLGPDDLAASVWKNSRPSESKRFS